MTVVHLHSLFIINCYHLTILNNGKYYLSITNTLIMETDMLILKHLLNIILVPLFVSVYYTLHKKLSYYLNFFF